MLSGDSEYISVSKEEYGELLQRLKATETEKNKLARELKTMVKRNAIIQMNIETQTGLNAIITREKERQETYVRLLLKWCPDPVFIFGENMEFLLGTDSIANVIDIEDISLLYGRLLDNIVERYHPSVFTEELIALIKNTADDHSEITSYARLDVSTESSTYEINVLPFHGNSGEFTGVLVLMHDITEITHSKEIAERASMAKGEFLSRMSHEMRTPMNAIIGMTSIAKRSDDWAKKEYCLEKIESASTHLLGVINDILDMSKIEANKFELSYEAFMFERMLINVVNVINFRVEEKCQTLIINLDDTIPEAIIGDELRVAQVLTNLLTNAVKFTPERGVITLTTKNLRAADGKPTLQIDIADTGIGISQEQQSRLFVSFEQADGGTARKYGGTGLGLAISKRIVELMGGSIWIESELGRGSKFSFTITYERGELKQQQRLNLFRDDIHILAVDDAQETRVYFTEVMSARALPCDVAADGFEALEMIIKSSAKPYNIFFIDWDMPGMDGIELTRKIKEITMENAIIIMISATQWSEIEKEALEAGVDRFISKPLFPSILIDNINECVNILRNEPDRDADSDITVVRDFYSNTILVAEDIEINREIIAATLEETCITIDFAENGAEAVAMIRDCPERYDLVFMDIQMPEMDGYEATRRIRSLDVERADSIPIIAMTANVFREDIEQCLAAGMNNHLGKPIDTDEMFKILDIYL